MKRKQPAPIAKEDIKAARKARKDDTDSDNLRNRLIEKFGADLISKKDGNLPSEAQGLEALLLRSCAKARFGLGASLETRTTTIPVGARKIFHDCPDGAYTKTAILDRLQETVAYVAKVRVAASHFANYYYLWLIRTGQQELLPEPNQSFFKTCLQRVRSLSPQVQMMTHKTVAAPPSSSRPVRKRPKKTPEEPPLVYPLTPFNTAWKEFWQYTKYTPPAALTFTVCQVLLHESIQMATGAKTQMELYFSKRQCAVLKWCLTKTLPRLDGIVQKQHRVRIHALAEVATTELKSADTIQTDLCARLQKYGYDAAAYWPQLREVVFCIVSASAPGSAPAGSQARQRLHLIHLQTTYIEADRTECNALWSELHHQYPGDTKEAKKQRRDMFNSKWPHPGEPPKLSSPLPQCHSKAAFIRIDKKGMKQLFPAMQISSGPWGHLSYMNPFAYKCNIPCLRTRYAHFGRSEGGMMKLIGRLLQTPDDKDLQCPWLMGPSFTTNGVQVHIQLLSVKQCHQQPHGLDKLHHSGYAKLRLGKGRRKHSVQDLLDRGNGVHHLADIEPCEDEVLQHVKFSSADPGQALVVCAITAPGEMWFDRSNAGTLLADPDPDPQASSSNSRSNSSSSTGVSTGVSGKHVHSQVSCEEYRTRTLAVEAETHEKMRRVRNLAYSTAIEELQQQHCRTSNLDQYADYCRYWVRHSKAMWSELLHNKRRRMKFARYSATQRTLEYVAEQIAPLSEAQLCFRAILFEAGSFRAMKGKASVPRKALLRRCARRAVTILIPARYTSSKCPCCSRKLSDGVDQYRTRVCTTSEPGVCMLHKQVGGGWSDEVVFNRDHVAACEIGYRGVYRLRGLETSSHEIPVDAVE